MKNVKKIITPEMKMRRWNKVLLTKCLRKGEDITAKWFQERIIPETPQSFTNIRALAKLYYIYRIHTEYGYHMSELMDGSGECGSFIYVNYETELRTDFETACEKFSVTLKEVMEAIEEINSVIFYENSKWESGGQPAKLWDEEYNWHELYIALEMAINSEKSYLPY